MNERDDTQWGVLRSDRVVEILSCERLARTEAAREGGQVVCRNGHAPWHRARLRLSVAA